MLAFYRHELIVKTLYIKKIELHFIGGKKGFFEIFNFSNSKCINTLCGGSIPLNCICFWGERTAAL